MRERKKKWKCGNNWGEHIPGISEKDRGQQADPPGDDSLISTLTRKQDTIIPPS